MVSGKKENFVVSPVIQPGSTAMITIKQNSEGKFLFGLFSSTDLGQDNSNIHVHLFDARQAVNGKRINIWRSEKEKGKFEASLLLTDEAEPQPLRDAGTKHYRDGERITKKDWLGWIVPKAISASATMFTSILSAATALPAGAEFFIQP